MNLADIQGFEGCPSDFGECLKSRFKQNFLDTNRGLFADDAVGLWRFLSSAVLGATYAVPTGTPGWFGLLNTYFSGLKITNTPSFVMTGARAGTLVQGGAAINAVALKALEGALAIAVGFEIGVGVGSFGVALFECMTGGDWLTGEGL